MFRYVLILAVLMTATAASPAQQLPGQWSQLPGEHGPSANGSAEEVTRLRLLVDEQKKKIALLEQKIKVLEAELRKAKGAVK